MTSVYREVKILQEDLKDNDAYNGPITGRFDLATFNGIKALVNSGKLGAPVEIPDPSEDTYGSVIAAVADELNYMPSAVNAVRTAYSEWAREAHTMYTPAVLSDFGREVQMSGDVPTSVLLFQKIMARGGWFTDRPREGLYKGPLDGNYTVAVENAFKQWCDLIGTSQIAFFGTDQTSVGLTLPVLRAINSARNAAGFGVIRVSSDKTPSKDVTKVPKRCPPGAVLYNQKRECPKGYVAIKDGSGCCAPLADSKTRNADEQAKKIAEAARVAAENARNAAKRAEEAALKAAKDKDAKAQAAAVQAAKEAEVKALAAQATIDAANAAAEAARLRAAEEAATALAAQDATNRAAAEQAAALQAAAAQAAQEAAAKVAAAQEALQYAQTQSKQPTPAYYEPPTPPAPPPQQPQEEQEQPPEEQPSKEVTPARQQVVSVEPKSVEAAPGTPWTKYFLIAAVAAAAIGGWWYYKNRATAGTADFDEEETPCPCSKRRGADDED